MPYQLVKFASGLKHGKTEIDSCTSADSTIESSCTHDKQSPSHVSAQALKSMARKAERATTAFAGLQQTGKSLLSYLYQLPTGKLILWCYLLWYLVILAFHFEPTPNLWLTSLGLSAIVGFAHYTNARSASRGPVALERWQTIRFFLGPFCTASFAAMVKGRGFFLIFPNRQDELFACIASCAIFCFTVLVIKTCLPAFETAEHELANRGLFLRQSLADRIGLGYIAMLCRLADLAKGLRRYLPGLNFARELVPIPIEVEQNDQLPG